MKQVVSTLCLCLISVIGWSQLRDTAYKPIFHLGYTQGTHSMFQLGMEYDVISSKDQWLFLGGGVMTTSYFKDRHWLPYMDVTHSNGLGYYGVKASTRHIQPQVGISLLNFIELGMGYAIPFNEDKVPVIKGFNFNLKIRFSGNEAIYPKLKIGF